jgi:5'-nucleotidase
MNNGGIRQDLETTSGNRVTLGHAMAVLPFGNTVVAMNLRGAQIRRPAGRAVAGRARCQARPAASVGRLWYEWDPRAAIGRKIVPGSVKLNGVPLEMEPPIASS